MNPQVLNATTLAYMGDVVWSLYVREYLISQGLNKADRLQKQSVRFVSAKAQAKVYFYLESEQLLSEEELDVFKRGRNAKSNSTPKNTEMMTYRISTGFEALIGYLYLNQQHQRIKELFEIAKSLHR
ncbi:MAG: ribonuclease III domain-containing protein [Erysipelotrichaceae bacterium]